MLLSLTLSSPTRDATRSAAATVNISVANTIRRLCTAGRRRSARPLNASTNTSVSFKRLLEKAGLRDKGVHDLRYSFASLLPQQGESVVYVKDQLGHASIHLTVDTYGHLIRTSLTAFLQPSLSGHAKTARHSHEAATAESHRLPESFGGQPQQVPVLRETFHT